MATYILNIGSNLGDRRLNLSRAVSRILSRFGDFEISHTIESDPWGYESGHKFLNTCLMFSSDESPLEVLAALQQIEKSISTVSHRNADGSYTDRVIDIDIVAVDDMVLDTPELKLPHPALPKRSFFLEPMAEIAPGWVHPLNGMTAAQMLEALHPLKADDDANAPQAPSQDSEQ